jgi:hypothetical protein
VLVDDGAILKMDQIQRLILMDFYVGIVIDVIFDVFISLNYFYLSIDLILDGLEYVGDDGDTVAVEWRRTNYFYFSLFRFRH